jgi:hypothetical protein
MTGSELFALKEYYLSGSVSRPVGEIVQKCCLQGVSPSYHPIACLYNSFEGKPPSAGMSIETSRLSLFF